MEAHDWATWQPMTGPRGTMPFAQNLPCVAIWFAHCQPIKNYHVTYTTSACTFNPRHLYQVNVRSCHVSLYGLPSQRPFFACLTFQTDRDISRSRCPFETKQIALGSWWRGLRSCSFWGNSENVDFWAKIWLLVQILITTTPFTEKNKEWFYITKYYQARFQLINKIQYHIPLL